MRSSGDRLTLLPTLVVLGAIAVVGGYALITGLNPSSTSGGGRTQYTQAVFRLHVANVDGPTVQLEIAGRTVATVACGASTVLQPGGEVPALPWRVEVRTLDGTLLNDGSVSFAQGSPWGLIVRGSSVLTGPYPMAYGPASSGCPSP